MQPADHQDNLQAESDHPAQRTSTPNQQTGETTASNGDLGPHTKSDPKLVRRTSPLVRTLLASLLLGGLLAGAGFLLHGPSGLEKTITKLVMPLGLSWLLLTGWILQSVWLGAWRTALLPSLLWILVTATSCEPISKQLTRYLESQISPTTLSRERPLDVVVVLGGGTNQGRTRAQAASSGDRVLYAAQLFHQGYTKQLITTGSATETLLGESSPDPSAQTIEIWTALGVPREAIQTLPGINTYREIESLSKAMESELAGKQIGVLTSATHLPRAMRLAEARGLNTLIPIAADYRGATQDYRFQDFLPSADSLAQFSRCQHEIMAGFVGR